MREVAKERHASRSAWRAAAAIMALQALVCFAAEPGDKPSDDNPRKPAPNYTSEAITGKVVWLADALRARFGIKTDDDAAHAVAALEGSDGRLYPILKDVRGRCFYTDERLRNTEMELLVRRYAGSPMAQVVRVYTLKPDGKYELDYWCDVCSIAMYELKPCECCQGETRLRERLVDKRQPPSANDASR